MTIDKFMATAANVVEGSVVKRIVGSGHAHIRRRAWMSSRLTTGPDRRSHMSFVRASVSVARRCWLLG